MISLLKKFFKGSGKVKYPLPNNASTNLITFNQIFFLYPIYYWILFRPHVPLLKSNVFHLISVIYVNLRNKFKFPDEYYENFSFQNGNIMNENISKMINIKIKENLIKRNEIWEYSLTEEGRLVIEDIIKGEAHKNAKFDSNIRFFTDELKQNIDDLLKEITKLPPDILRQTAIIAIK